MRRFLLFACWFIRAASWENTQPCKRINTSIFASVRESSKTIFTPKIGTKMCLDLDQTAFKLFSVCPGSYAPLHPRWGTTYDNMHFTSILNKKHRLRSGALI